MKKLKKKKKELKEEVAKLRGTIPVRYVTDEHDASTSDVEVVEEPNIGSSQSNPAEEEADNSDVNSNNVDKETASQSNGGAQVEDNSWLTIEDAAEEMEADNSAILRSLTRKLLTTQVEQEVLRCQTNVLNVGKDLVHLGISHCKSKASMGQRKSAATATR